MRILYDHQTFMYQSIGGISQYFTQLMISISSYATPVLSLDNTKNEYAKDIAKFSIVPLKIEHGTSRIKRIADRILGINPRKKNSEMSLSALIQGKYDIFHPTAYDPYCLTIPKRAPMVITFHDCIQENFPEFFSPDDNMTVCKRAYISKADAIICISKYTKSQFLKYFEYDEKKIFIVPHGIDHGFYNNAGRNGENYLNKYGKYLLFVGGRQGYKNWLFWLRAVAPIILKNEHTNILCTGRCFTTQEKNLIVELGLKDRVFSVSLSRYEMPAVYGGARCFFYPSLEEGFGLPTLEAMASGCPVALSDIPVMREVAGESALFFEPKNSRAIAETCENLLSDDELCARLKKAGLEHSLNFNWQRTAKMTMSVYEQVIGL